MAYPRKKPHLDLCFTEDELKRMKHGYTTAKIVSVSTTGTYRIACTLGDQRKQRKIQRLERELQLLKRGIDLPVIRAKDTTLDNRRKWKWSEAALLRNRERIRRENENQNSMGQQQFM